uniref:Immunoglobulin domain-containing protein n=1 Tax=Neolamprologus brichardi TaxID=32507 RepID=A0A3Q4I1G4_NEOBR
MAAHLSVLLLFSVLKGHKVSVEAGKSISIPCLYESKYIDHVKYLCKGHIWSSCSYAVKTNKPDPSGKYSIYDDKKEQIFTVTIKNLTNQNTDYWCVVEINNGLDCGQYFQLSVTSGTPSLYLDHQKTTGYIGENITIRCHRSNSGEMKWCRLGRNCVTGSFGSIDGTTVTTHMRDPNVFTVTMTGLRSEDSGWYWCAEGDIQIPVYLNVTEKPINSEYCKLSKILHVNEFNTFINICTLRDFREFITSLFAECDVELTYSSVVKKQRIKWVNIKRPEANHTLDVTSLCLLISSIILLVVLVFHDFFLNFVTFFLAFFP